MQFKDPWILLLIPVILIVVYFVRTLQKPVTFRIPSTFLLRHVSSSWKIRFRYLSYLIRLIVLILFLVALAGPRSVLKETVRKSEGIDIVLAIDASGSMAAEDFKVNDGRLNRLEIVRQVVREFIDQRESDRLGLVAFAGLAYTVCPLTTDYTWLKSNLNRVELGIIQDGTAVGSAVAAALTRLEDSDAKSKVIILLTDGINNAGEIDPVEAARAAEALGVKIYTIGAGTKGYVPFPVKDFFGRNVYQNVLIDLDENTLREMAKMTGGQYFRATDTESLRQVYAEIDALEKVKFEELNFLEYEELFSGILILALLLLSIELFLSNTVLLQIP